MKGDKAALPRSSEANSAGLGWLAREGSFLGNSIKDEAFRGVLARCETLGGLQPSPNFMFNSSGDRQRGQDLSWLERWERTSTPLSHHEWLAAPSIVLLCSWVLSYSPISITGHSRGLGTKRIISLCSGLWALKSRNEKSLLTYVLLFVYLAIGLS